MTDRKATVREADRLLREGHVEGAVAAYLRLVEQHPGDWNLLNALGDAYLRAGDRERAAARFAEAADGLSDRTQVSKAAALYKKALKVSPDHEHSLSRLGALAAQQSRLVDARRYVRKLADLRRVRGDRAGVAECLDRLAALEGPDPESKVAAAHSARDAGDHALAAAMLKGAARAYEEQGRASDAFEKWIEALDANPGDAFLAAKVARAAVETPHLDRARRALGDADGPDILLALARVELAAGNREEARAVAARLLAVAPERHTELVHAACEMAARDAEAAFGVVELVVDSLSGANDWTGATRALEAFSGDVPHIPALMRLVELAIEGGRDDLMRHTQARLCDAYLEAGRALEARVLAEDLVAGHPGDEEHARRLRRVVNALATSAPARPAEPPETTESALAGPHRSDEHVAIEVDLSDRLTVSDREPDTDPALARPDLPEPEDLEGVFGRIRGRIGREHPDAAERYQRGVRLLGEGRLTEAIADLEQAARAPMLRFKAAARLGRVHLASGDLEAGVNWLDLAAEAATPDPEEGRLVLYDLADSLERLGDTARALAILIELDAEAGEYRDVRQRIERLTQAEAGRDAR